MIIIPQVPCKYTKDFPTEIEFILLHKLINNEAYRNYYIENKNNGKFKILDNSAFELGAGLSDELLMEWAEKINATEIIIPDIYGDKDKTLELMKSFLTKYPDCKYKLMAVPQGKDSTELNNCFSEMMTERKITCIGLNKLWKRDKSKPHKRTEIEYTLGIIKALSDKDVHILGVNDLSDWTLNGLREARSADSRILTKIVTGVDDCWEEELNETQLIILKRLIEEVGKW